MAKFLAERAATLCQKTARLTPASNRESNTAAPCAALFH